MNRGSPAYLEKQLQKQAGEKNESGADINS